MRRELSSIELTVLGMAYLRGPCSTYTLMKELSTSSSTYYKSRAGTAYSVTRRLLEFGLLGSVGDHVEITPAGISALQEWVAPPIPLGDVAHSADLVRARFFFLGVLRREDQLAFIDACLAGLEEFHTRCEALIGENEKLGEYYGALATVSVVLETRARMRWLRLVRKWIEEPIPEGVSWTKTILEALDK